ncbi:uracil-DNA glycosylase family protein [Qipengyuania sp. G39]|uniref:Uracil-DNA glycosylase family protein n=1 Tax=Qipengyuania profundimaris TaxID=3067652 RepID=A0ABT9HNW0_9SPHN|nr:uracil-DNA glycosylase family protein [Qipengyuania sp. G39]MDP4574838.1 uracil-DNA glycosylase family protein [Qipengyuania sp. G39]
MSAEALKREIRGCTLCAEHLPLGPKPVVQFSATSRVVVIGQAPGRITHQTGLAFDDKSGHRLADWLGVDFDTLHDPARFAIVSMGFCYPGKASGGDKPPRPECAPTWHERVWSELPEDRLTLLVGTYAQRAYLPETKSWTMLERIQRWREFLPHFLPLPHPAWRSTLFIRDHPWFEAEVLPALRREVAQRIR